MTGHDRTVISRLYKELKKLNTKRTNNPVSKRANELNRHALNEEVQMSNKYMKKCSISLVIREMQVKCILRFCLTPVRMTIIKKTNNSKCW
jgi:hypothetical protein